MKVKKDNILNFISNNKKIFSVMLVFMVMFSLGLALLDHATYSADDVDSLKLICDDTVAGGEFTCTIELNSVTMVSKGISSKYTFDEGIEFVDFIPEDIWTAETNDEDGFVIVNLEGVTGTVTVGTIKFFVSDDALPNDVYNVGLVDSTIGDGEEGKVIFETVSDKVNILSTDSKLKSITFSDGSEIVVSDTINEEVIYSINSVTVEVNDSNAKIDGDDDNDGKVTYNLSEGENVIKVKVIAESGEEKIYTLNITRKSISTDNGLKSITFSDGKEIIVSDTINEEVIYSINSVTVEVNDSSAKIDGDDDNDGKVTYDLSEGENVIEVKVIAESGEEKIYTLNITRKSISTDSKLKSIILSDGTNIPVDNQIDVEVINSITSLIVERNDNSAKIDGDDDNDGKVTYDLSEGENIIEVKVIAEDGSESNYVFKVFRKYLFALNFDDKLNIDEDNNYIINLDVDIQVEELLNMVYITGDGNAFVEDNDGDERGNTASLVTGDKLVIYKDEEIYEEYTLSVTGDVNGDGKVSLVDLVQVRKHIVGWVDKSTGDAYEKTGIYFYAADMNQDGKISLVDLVRVRKKIVGAN